MAEIECFCDKVERLEGTPTQAYISQFLEMTGVDEETGKTYYLCRVCGRPWAYETIEVTRKPSLVRLETEFYV